ncbi:unnamed protein product [Rhizoctonia solani]|uniref:DUF7918 domain-containing protein n=1 Tax=Rhizoctonia solani TaxID=456999 RepID=A0A8H3CBY4_9AGAM|nr:unnamed protein product [Rhizoctonia solani]
MFVYPYLDGVRMCGCSWTKDQVATKDMGELGHHPTGHSSFRLYEFGKRRMTDKEDVFQTGRPRALLNELNAIKVRFAWGHQGAVVERTEFFDSPSESAPIHEVEAKPMQGLSGSAQLSQNNTMSGYSYSSCDFNPAEGVKATTFIFRYASREWLQARDIIERTPRRIGSPSPRIIPKRARSITPKPIIIGKLEAKDNEDDDVVFVKHVIPVKAGPRKKKCLAKLASAQSKTEPV